MDNTMPLIRYVATALISCYFSFFICTPAIAIEVATAVAESEDKAQFLPKEPLEERLKKHIIFHSNASNQIGHILIDDHVNGINQSTWLYVKKALDHYKHSKPVFIILELNTPGGEVFPAQQISDALKEIDTQYNIPVVAFINNWAISAGAMLAFSSRFIAVVKDGSMGAVEPVLAGEGGEMKQASEKVNSAMRADLANRAGFFGRNPYIAEAMVDKDVIVVLRDGKILKLDDEKQIRMAGEDPDTIINRKGKLLTLNAEQLMQYGVADIALPPVKIEEITAQEKESGQWPASKMLLFQQPFFKEIPEATIDSYRMDWKTYFFVFLANPVVSSLLMLGLMLGAYTEFSSPGLTFPGTVAAFCLFFITLSSFSLEIAGWLELILLATGILILVVEFFVLPTFGLLGFIGIIFFLVGLFGMLLPGADSVQFDFGTQTFNSAGLAFFERLAWLCATLVLGFVLILFMARYITPSLRSFRRFVSMGSEQESSKGYRAGLDVEKLPKAGAKGVVLSTLRPAGNVFIHDTIYDALSNGNFIERGTPIIVLYVEGSALVVDVDPDVASHVAGNPEKKKGI